MEEQSWKQAANELRNEGEDRLTPMVASASSKKVLGSKAATAADTEMQQIMPNVVGVRTDQQLQLFLAANTSGSAVVSYGSSWCSHCHAMLPPFLSLAKRNPQVQFAVAQVDYMQQLKGVSHTPTFAFYKRGSKVDQFYGASEQQLQDHMWLYTD